MCGGLGMRRGGRRGAQGRGERGRRRRHEHLRALTTENAVIQELPDDAEGHALRFYLGGG